VCRSGIGKAGKLKARSRSDLGRAMDKEGLLSAINFDLFVSCSVSGICAREKRCKVKNSRYPVQSLSQGKEKRGLSSALGGKQGERGASLWTTL